MITTLYVIDFDYYFKVIIDIICERRDRISGREEGRENEKELKRERENKREGRKEGGGSERASERACKGGEVGGWWGGGQRGGMRLPSRCRFPGALRANRPGACYACFLFFFCAARSSGSRHVGAGVGAH